MAIGAAAACAKPSSVGSSRSAIAGSPRKPMPSEASVMPNWQAERYSLRSSSCLMTTAARRSPAEAISSSLARLARTSANSAATKKPLAKISTMTALSRSAVKRRECGRA